MREKLAQTVLFSSFLVVSCVGLISGCTPASDPAATTSATEEPRSPYRNLVDGVSFVGDDACFDCHESEYRGYKEHGMANSFYLLNADTRIEKLDGSVVHDTTLGYSYTISEEDGKFYQEEFRIDENGQKTHSQVREMQYVIGSGISARSYFILNNGWFNELPISWYTQEGKWDFSPGYRVANKRFDRKIVPRCMNCHNAYPTEVPFTEGKYEHLPLGISCERCHGPGELHVEERLALPEADSVDYSIVNPAHLTLERRLDVCQQCHLNATVSILREGRTPYDFRPSQDLSKYLSLYAMEKPASNEMIGLTSHVGRMKASECFRSSLAQGNPMDCVTCHDPHSGFRQAGPEYFNATCRTCHESANLIERLAGSTSLPDHQESSNCISCHMPKAGISKVAHSDFTDHWIRVVDPDEPVQLNSIGDPPKLLPVFAQDLDDQIYEGLAYLVYGTRNLNDVYMRMGIGMLEETLTLESDYDEAVFQLGLGYHRVGDVESAIPWLEQAVIVESDIPERLNALAQAYETGARDPVRIERLYQRALAVQPARADYRINYGRFLESRGRLVEAVREYRMALVEQPWFATAHYNLGTALVQLGDSDAAEKVLGDALDLDPLNPDAWVNLGILFATNERLGDALEAFKTAVGVSPGHPLALANLGAHYLQADSLALAILLLSQATEIAPEYVEARVNLALAYFRNDQFIRAREEAEAVLEFAPSNKLALQILNAL